MLMINYIKSRLTEASSLGGYSILLLAIVTDDPLVTSLATTLQNALSLSDKTMELTLVGLKALVIVFALSAIGKPEKASERPQEAQKETQGGKVAGGSGLRLRKAQGAKGNKRLGSRMTRGKAK